MSQPAFNAQPAGLPDISVGREICGDLPSALCREWLVTNGLGGYASSTLAGVNTRRYHGLLVAALTPPVARTVLVGGLVEWATTAGQRMPLSTHEYADGTLDPHGYLHLQSFALAGTIPVWTYALGVARIERRVWMPHGANATYVSYTLARGDEVELEITPLVTYRDFHTLRSGQGWQPATTANARGVVVTASADAVPIHLLASAGSFMPSGEWYWNFRHREETARGLDDRSDLFAPGTFHLSLTPGESRTLVLAAGAAPEMPPEEALAAERARQADLLRRADAAGGRPLTHPLARQLVLAADQFLVTRQADPSSPAPNTGTPSDQCTGKTVIAGYHWFNDWGRDTMIALPGLTLATGRPEIAADILRTFARYVRDGLLPNNFPDQAGQVPGYNTADATLWYILATHAYQEVTGDRALVAELLPVLREIVERHIAGTRYSIGMDPADGLLRAGEPGVQLTWMDAKVGEWIVTPRIGKPVEINALWYNALRMVAGFLRGRDDAAAEAYSTLAERVRVSFRARFGAHGPGALADVVDGPDGDDWRLRPNQIFAVSLPFPLLEGAEAAAVVAEGGRALLTTYGLRSLSADDLAYRGTYGGDQRQRDGAYHQGTVWAWLLGAYAEASARVTGDPAAALALLAPFAHHLMDAGLGSISEIFEGNPPHLPRGCVAQAWSVAEVLRVWRRLTEALVTHERVPLDIPQPIAGRLE